MAYRQLTEEQAVDLEGLVDSHSLETVIEALAVICTGKGEHLRTNWQDYVTARQWEAASSKLMGLAATQTIKNVS